MYTTLRGTGPEVRIGPDLPLVIIGERLNPTGRKRLAQELRSGKLDRFGDEAASQVQEGASVIDINVGASGVDEVAFLPLAMEQVLKRVEVPLCIDSANPQALAAALSRLRKLVPEGKVLVNSVTGEEARRKEVLPLVKEYGAAVIGLCMDDKGIPPTPEGRLCAAEKILKDADRMGIPREDIILDCLALGQGSEQAAGRVTLEAIRLAKKELGLNQTLGVSNVSFGLPDRNTLNGAFLAMAILAGVNCPIIDPAASLSFALAADLLMGRDPFALRYIREFRKRR